MHNTIWLVNNSLSFIPLVSSTSFLIIKNSCFREELSDLPSFLQTQLQQSTAEEHIFGEFLLATLTFGSCNYPTDTFPFTYLFPSVSISICWPLNWITIHAEDDFQYFQRSVNIFNNSGLWSSPFLILSTSIHWIIWCKRYGSLPLSTH